MTRLGDYLAATGTKNVWLAEQVGVNSSTVTRWIAGTTPMREADKQKILAALRARALVPLDGLLDDQALPTRAEQIRDVAKCAVCHEVKPGVSTIQRATWSSLPPGHRSHICDDCDAKILERPLDAVLGDFLSEP